MPRPLGLTSAVSRKLREKRVVYLRELQLYLEDDYAHWDTYNELTRLARLRRIRTKSYRRQRWFFPKNLAWEDVEAEASRKAYLVERYVKHPRKYRHEGKNYDDYSEYLVKQAFRQAGYLVAAKNTNYFNARVYRRAGAPRRGRPPDLDFIVLVTERIIPIGVQVKNRLDYPDNDSIDEFLAMCTQLEVRPLLVARMALEMQNKRVIEAGGKVVMFKRWLIKPPFPRSVFRQLRALGLPFSVYQYTPDFLVGKFIGMKRDLLAK